MTLVIFPIFDRCKDYTLDNYWRDWFINCAHNKFPPGLRYDANHKSLLVKTAKSTESIILSDEPIDTFKIMMRVFREMLEMKSAKDLQVQSDELEEARKKRAINLECEWKKLKPRHIRDQFILNYIADMKKKYDLKAIETRQLASVIQLGFQFHNLTSDDVEYSSGIIHNIAGLCFDEKKRIFYTTKKPTASSSKSEKNAASSKFYQSVDKFIREYSARSSKVR
jgi:hypothetical protein